MLQSFLGNMDVAVMGWVEGTTKQADTLTAATETLAN